MAKVVETIEVPIRIDRADLDATLADLERAVRMKAQLEVPSLKAQLEATEKAYDSVLQENVKLRDRVRDLEAPHLGGQFGMGPEADELGDLLEQVEAKPALCDKTDVWDDTDAKLRAEQGPDALLEILQDHPDTPIHMDSADPPSGSFKMVAGHDAKEGEELVVSLNDTKLTDRQLRQQITNLERQVTNLEMLWRRAKEKTLLAQGGRAKMKDSLLQSQNANRKYKQRLAQQKPQLKALRKVADRAFPLYAALTNALGQPRVTGTGTNVLVMLRVNSALEDQCAAFHDAFNEALTGDRE